MTDEELKEMEEAGDELAHAIGRELKVPASELRTVGRRLNLLASEVGRLRADNARLVEACKTALPFIQGWFVGYPEQSPDTAAGALEKLRAAIEGK